MNRRNRLDLLLIKSEILCNGLKCNEFSEELSSIFDPTKTKRTGNVGIHFRIGGHVVNAAMDKLYDNPRIYTNESRFELRRNKGNDKLGWVLLEDNKELFEVYLIRPPSWYQRRTISGVRMSRLFLCEGEANLMGSISDYCCLFEDNAECMFCGLDQTEVSIFSAIDFSEVAVAAMIENPNSTITLTCGSVNDLDRGAKLISCYAETILNTLRESNLLNIESLPFQVECAPPRDIEYISRLADVGVNSFSINLELYSDEVRNAICPGKSRITKNTYERTWNYIVDLLGPYRVGSALLVGIEPKQSSLEGARYLLDQGVLPNMLPFKPIPGSKFEERPTIDSKDYYQVCREVSELFDAYTVDRKSRLGCTTCGACSMEMDIFDI